MLVICRNEKCRWNCKCSCGRGLISLGNDNECKNFENYQDNAEWQKPFWKRLYYSKTDQMYRVLFYGKEIEIYGEKFFVDSDSDNAVVTEEKTGLNCGYVYDLESRIEKIIECRQKVMADLPPLETLPIGEYDKTTDKVIPIVKGGAGSD
jgi:hypothetical protein